jgi:hypothetical protein
MGWNWLVDWVATVDTGAAVHYRTANSWTGGWNDLVPPGLELRRRRIYLDPDSLP